MVERKDGGPAFPDENILPDDYPVYCGYVYVADGRVVFSPVQGTVGRLKREIGALEIRRCNLVARHTEEQDR